MENRRLHVTQPKHVVANSYGSFGAENEKQKGNCCRVYIQAHDKRIRFSPDAYLCHVGVEISLFLLVICVFLHVVYLLFCSVVYYVYRAPLVRACCLLYGSTPESWLGDYFQAPTGGCALTTTRVMGESLMFFRSDRGVVPSQAIRYVHAPLDVL